LEIVLGYLAPKKGRKTQKVKKTVITRMIVRRACDNRFTLHLNIEDI